MTLRSSSCAYIVMAGPPASFVCDTPKENIRRRGAIDVSVRINRSRLTVSRLKCTRTGAYHYVYTQSYIDAFLFFSVVFRQTGWRLSTLRQCTYNTLAVCKSKREIIVMSKSSLCRRRRDIFARVSCQCVVDNTHMLYTERTSSSKQQTSIDVLFPVYVCVDNFEVITNAL